MTTADDGIETDQAAQLNASWTDVEPRIERLSRGPARAAFFRRLHGEYRVAALYSETACTAGMRRYAAELQTQGLRTMRFDGINGAAQYIVGAYIASLLQGSADVRTVYDRAFILINRAISFVRTGDADDVVVAPEPVCDNQLEAPRIGASGNG